MANTQFRLTNMEKITNINLIDETFIEELIEISGLINEFDGQIFSLNAIRKRLEELKKVPAVKIAHNIEKTLAELPNYSNNYKVYNLINTSEGAIVKITKEAKKFLINPDEADIEGFFNFRAIL